MSVGLKNSISVSIALEMSVLSNNTVTASVIHKDCVGNSQVVYDSVSNYMLARILWLSTIHSIKYCEEKFQSYILSDTSLFNRKMLYFTQNSIMNVTNNLIELMRIQNQSVMYTEEVWSGMRGNAKSKKYCLVKARYICFLYIGFAISILFLAWDILQWVKEKELLGDEFIDIGNLLIFMIFLLYAKYSDIKRKILVRHGLKHQAEIVRAKYTNGRGRWAGFSFYYLEIDFTNSKGKKKILYTPAYIGNPNDYLKSAKCSVYEWKGFYVEGDLQVRDEIDYFGYAEIPTEKKHFIWR